jgi:hypothetical protein
MLLADRGYDAGWIRALAGEHGAWANIPPERNRKDPFVFSPYLYRARNLVERFFNRNKQCRRVRYDKLAANHRAFIKLAAIRIWLRAYETTSQSLLGSSGRSSICRSLTPLCPLRTEIHISHCAGLKLHIVVTEDQDILFSRRCIGRELLSDLLEQPGGACILVQRQSLDLAH